MQATQGLVLTILELTILFYIINYTEYFLWLDTAVRGMLFYAWWISVLVLSIGQVGIPLSRMFLTSSNRLSPKKAAGMIGSHFPEIQDKLLNYLQLEEMNAAQSKQNQFLIKSIDQKMKLLRPFRFLDALDFQKFRRDILRFSLVIVLLLLWGIFDSDNINASAGRLFSYKDEFQKPAPFEFDFSERDKSFEDAEPMVLHVKLIGNDLPNRVFAEINGQSRMMQRSDSGGFVLTIQNPIVDTRVQFAAAGFQSKVYSLDVKRSVDIEDISIQALYPAYVNRESDDLPYKSSFTVPYGTRLTWRVKAKNAKSFKLNNELSGGYSKKRLRWTVSKKMLSSDSVRGILYGIEGGTKSFNHFIEVMPDAEPVISVVEQRDSLQENVFFIRGEVSDDYGLNSVSLQWREVKSQNIETIHLASNQDRVYTLLYALNLKEMELLPGQSAEYRIVAKDNNQINGGSTTTSDWRVLRRWTEKQYQENLENAKEELQKTLSENRRNSENLHRQNQKIKESFLRQKSLDFDLKQKISEWLEKQKSQQNQFENALKKQQELERKSDELPTKNKELKERREELQDRMERLKDPKLEALLDELNKLLEKQASKQEIQQKMDQIDRRMQNQQDDLESIEEQLKELRMEETIDHQLKEMSEWIKKQQELEKKSEKATNKEEQTKIQQELSKQEKKAEDIKERSKKIGEQNKALKEPMKLKTGEQKTSKAAGKTREAKEAMKDGQSQKSLQKQKAGESEMTEAMENLEESLEESKQKRNSEDMESLRALLDNLVEVSHQQERVFIELSELDSENPRVKELNKQQVNIKNMSSGIEDSLRALARRQPMVSDMVTREISEVNENMSRAFDELKVRSLKKASMYEQYVMTGYNNLAVMLMESLKNVQQKMQSSSKAKSGKKSNSSSSNGKSGKSEKGKGSKLSEQQEKLGKQLQQMQMEQGSKSGEQQGDNQKSANEGEGKNQGQRQGKNQKKGNPKGKKGESSRLSDKELVEMILTQEEIRRKIEQMRKEALKNGETGMAANLFEVEKLMNEQEKEWADKKLSNQSLWRQKEILTRLLEHEKAERKQQQDNQRKSNSPKSYKIEFPPELLKWKQDRKTETEKLYRIPPALDPYYKRKSGEYAKPAT